MTEKKAWTVIDLLRWTTEYFSKAGIETARLDAELLLSHSLGTDRLHLYTNFDSIPSEEKLKIFRALVKERAARVPCKILLGRAEFYDLEFYLERGVFVPRPETELLVKTCLELAGSISGEIKIADICTGSGAIQVKNADTVGENKEHATL